MIPTLLIMFVIVHALWAHYSEPAERRPHHQWGHGLDSFLAVCLGLLFAGELTRVGHRGGRW